MNTTSNSIHVVPLSTYVQNILYTFDQATHDERIVGASWYSSAHEQCRQLAYIHKTTVEVVVCMMAALSPRNSWTNNKLDCSRILAALEMGTEVNRKWLFAFDANVDKAIDIYRTGGNDFSKLINIVGKGNKTRSFAYCMMYPNNASDVCIDTHAYSVCMGERKTSVDAQKAVFSKHKGYSLFAQAYIEAAKRRGVKPLVMQATAWVTYRRLHNINV